MIQTSITVELGTLPNQRANVDILRRELGSPEPSQVYVGGTSLVCSWDSLLTQEQYDVKSVIIATHQGELFSSNVQQSAAHDDLWGQLPFEVASSEWATLSEHNTGPLPEGVYLCQWTAEMKIVPEAPGEDVEIRALLLNWKGVPETEISLSSSDSDRWHDWTNGSNLPLLAGESIHLRFEARSVGGNSVASVRRMRLRIGRA
jgi:hypothetical protein